MECGLESSTHIAKDIVLYAKAPVWHLRTTLNLGLGYTLILAQVTARLTIQELLDSYFDIEEVESNCIRYEPPSD